MSEEVKAFEERLERRRAQHAQARAQASETLFGADSASATSPSFTGLAFEDAIVAYDDWIEQRLRDWRDEPPPDPPPPAPAVRPSRPERSASRKSHQGRMEPITRLAEMDRFVSDAFALDEFLQGLQLDLPPIVECATVEHFAGALERVAPHLRPSFPRWLNDVRQRPGDVLPGNPLSALAHHISGKATYFNAAQLPLKPNGPNRKYERLQRSVRVVAAERWGHGFLEHCTMWGQDINSRDLGPIHLLRRLGAEIPPSPAAARESVLAESALFTSAGWAIWIGDYLARRVRVAEKSLPQGEAGRMTLSQVWDAIKRLARLVPLETWAQLLGAPILGLDRLYESLSETLRWLLLSTTLEGQLINGHTRWMQRSTLYLEPLAQQRLGFSLRGELGQLLLSKVEAHLGPMLVPYAVLLAANLDFEEQQEAEALRAWLDEDVWQNVDARLNMLTKLDRSVKHNVTTLMSTAVHALRLQPLEGMQWT